MIDAFQQICALSVRRLSIARYVLLSMLSTVALAGCEDGGGLSQAKFPSLEVTPTQLVLNTVAVGTSTSKVIVLRNRGGSKLRITALDFSNAIDAREFQRVLETDVSADAALPSLPIILGGNESINVRVIYSPINEGSDSGELIVRSNDPDRPTVSIPIQTAESESELIIDPDRLIFNVGPDAQPLTLAVTLQNLGTIPVTITSVGLDPTSSADFSRPEGANNLVALAQGESTEVEVTYTPTGGDSDNGTLIIETDDAAYARVLIPLLGDQPSPEIDVSPASVAFGAVELDSESDITQLFVENQGTANLLLEEINFAIAQPGTNEQFTLHGLSDVEWPITVEPNAVFSFGINYHPSVDGRHETSIALFNNDRDESLYTIPVNGRVRKPCISVIPEAVDFGRVALAQTSARSRVQIVNCGDLPLDIESIQIDNALFHWNTLDGLPPEGFVIDPLGSAGLEVWYTNEALAQGELTEATMTIENNTPDTPTIIVPLRVVGGGAPTCDIVVAPNRVDFGLVARGTLRTRVLQAINRGTGNCTIRSEAIAPLIDIPIPGFNNVKFILTQPLNNGRNVGPGEFAPLEVTYRPDAFFADQARYTVTYWDPFSMQEKRAVADLVGVGGDSNIEVIPGHVDFGQVTAGECASREERVTVYNTGLVNLCISDIRFEGDDCDTFILVDRPIADADGCITVTRNTPADFSLVYEPSDLGVDDCEMIFISDDQDNRERRVPLHGEGVRDRRQTDVFEQTSGRSVDVLFIVDNSGSMDAEQASLRDNFAAFIRDADAFENDYQLGVVTTDTDSENDQGRLRPPRIMSRGADVERTFQRTIEVGTNGSADERGLEAAYRALSDPLIFDTGVACQADGDCVEPDQCVEGVCGGHNRGFLRENAALELVFVSDEDDRSASPLNFYVDFFKNIKGFRNETLFHAHAIVGVENGRAAPCNGPGGDAEAGPRYVDVAQRTNGGVFSICDDDFGRPLRDIGTQAFGLPKQFFLSRPAIRASIVVTIDGQPTEDGWVFDEPSNAVVFDDNAVPEAGQMISITYEAVCFPRRGN